MELIDIFNKIRDIPYKISLDFSEENHACSGKATKLKKELERMGYSCRFRVCEFYWSQLQLPEKLLKISHSDLATHVFLEAQINNLWIKLDPTWDSGLSKVFPISEWDGQSSTILAVSPIKTYGIEESKQIMANNNRHEFEDDIKVNGKFYQALNQWTSKIRR